MPPQISVRLSRTHVFNQVGFTYSPTSQTFLWYESFKRDKAARSPIVRTKSIFSGLNTQLAF